MKFDIWWILRFCGGPYREPLLEPMIQPIMVHSLVMPYIAKSQLKPNHDNDFIVHRSYIIN